MPGREPYLFSRPPSRAPRNICLCAAATHLEVANILQRGRQTVLIHESTGYLEGDGCKARRNAAGGQGEKATDGHGHCASLSCPRSAKARRDPGGRSARVRRDDGRDLAGSPVGTRTRSRSLQRAFQGRPPVARETWSRKRPWVVVPIIAAKGEDEVNGPHFSRSQRAKDAASLPSSVLEGEHLWQI